MGVRKTFIQNLKFYRKRAGLTQEKLAEAIETAAQPDKALNVVIHYGL